MRMCYDLIGQSQKDIDSWEIWWTRIPTCQTRRGGGQRRRGRGGRCGSCDTSIKRKVAVQ